MLSIAIISLFSTVSFSAPLNAIECYSNVYATYIESIQGNEVKMQDGRIIVWNDGKKKNFDQLIADADLEDTLLLPYPKFTSVNNAPGLNEDPGRIRNYQFLGNIYGDSEKQVNSNLVTVKWLPYAQVKKVKFNKQNGASAALEKVVKELNELPPEYNKYLNNIGGTFNYRVIAGTNLLSAHSYGIAIDIDTKYSDYWRDNQENLKDSPIKFKNNIPQKIVDIFEKNNFIWGGRWYHLDTMHFEYRPELFCKQ